MIIQSLRSFSMEKIFAFLWLLSCYPLCSKAQQNTGRVDIQHYRFSIEVSDLNDTIRGTAEIELEMAGSSLSLDLATLDSAGRGMHVSQVKEDNRDLMFTHSDNTLKILFAENGSLSTHRKLSVSYYGIPSDGLIISRNKFNHRTFFADNWPNRAHYWIPCIDHPSDKATVDFIVMAPDHYQVIANGQKTEEINWPGHLRETHYQESVELPTKEMAIGVADFAVHYAGAYQCIPVYSWVFPEERVNGFFDYDLALDILPYFITRVGPYPYKKLANVESRTRFGGAENANAIFYSENSIRGDRSNESLLVHEIAHQWFGNSATEKDWRHLWLSEGFATYMTHLYLEHKYGSDTLRFRMSADRQKVIDFARIRHTPVVDSSAAPDFMKLLNANSYQKGGWVLHMLHQKIRDAAFWQGIRAYYARFAGHNADTDDFRREMEKASGTDLGKFFQQWLWTPGHPVLDIKWKYRAKPAGVVLQITQLQSPLFEFPLQVLPIAGGGPLVATTVEIKQKRTEIVIPMAERPLELKFDPDVNLLFETASPKHP